jgi:Cu(I)/Ag(I) efflux system membrane fusion protein
MNMDLVPVYEGESSDGAVQVPSGMQQALAIRTQIVERGLRVPREALIRTATRTAVVRVRADGSFEPVAVVIGRESGDLIEITAGLKEGDRIVTSGQFLLDAESNLRAGVERLAPAPAASASPPGQGASP